MSSKKIRIQLYADENFPVPSATFLKSIGISIVHAYDFKLINKGDRIHLKQAKKLKRTLITIDRDFLYYSELTSKDSFGAIVISTGNAVPLHINNICKKSLPKISNKMAKGSYIEISQKKIVCIKGRKRTEIGL